MIMGLYKKNKKAQNGTIIECHRNPCWYGDFVYYGTFSDGNSFGLHIPERDIPEFIETLVKAVNDDSDGKVKVTIPHAVVDKDGFVHFVEGKVERIDK